MGQQRALILFFVLTCGISWGIWAPLWLSGLGVENMPTLPFHHALGAAGPISAVFIVTALEAGSAGMRDLIKRMGRWRGHVLWVLIALVGPFAVLGLAIVGAWLFEGVAPSLAGVGVSREFPELSVLGFFAYNVVSFGYGEETGWRGYALPRLQALYSALVATVVLTAGWAFWHLPLFLYRPGYSSMDVGGIVGWLFSLLAGALLLTWLYNSSRGSILVVALFHAAIDVVFTSDLSSSFTVNTTGALIMLWGVAVLLIRGPRYLSREGKVITVRKDGDVATVVASEPSASPRAA